MGNNVAYDHEPEDPTGVPHNWTENPDRFPIHRAAFFKNGSYDYFLNSLVAKYPDEAIEVLKKRDGLLALPLHHAIAGGQFEVVKQLIELYQRFHIFPNGVVNETMRGGVTPLHVALYKGQYEIARLLIAAGADVNSKTGDSYPLHVVARQGGKQFHAGALALIDELVAKGANLNAKDDSNLTPVLAALDDNDLGDAIAKHQEEIILHIMAMPSVDLRARMPETKYTPLHLACSGGYPRVLEKLLALDSTLVNEEIEGGRTALHLAAESDSASTVKILLSAPGVVVDKKTEKGETPLFNALNQGSVEIVRALLEAKADPNDVVANEPILHHAVATENTDLISLLIEFKVDMNKPGAGGSTALHKLALTGCLPQIAATLIRAGAQVNARDDKGFTPLYVACGYNGYEDLVTTLIAQGADVNGKTNGDATPLHAAAHKGLVEVMQYLISAGANVNAVTKSGKTPIKLAMDNKKTQAAEFLLLNGATT